MKNCYRTHITNLQPHPNADALEIAHVDGWQVIVQPGLWNVGDPCIYIAPDACIPQADWSGVIYQYTDKGRVKIIKLRGEISCGIILPAHLSADDDPSASLGITHYISRASQPSVQNEDLLWPKLPYCLSKTDEENWESLPEAQLHLGDPCLMTRKIDGCSATYIATPEGRFHVCSRNQELRPEGNNIYSLVGRTIVQSPLVEYAQKHGRTIIVRGEITGPGVNAHRANKDAQGPVQFHLFKCMFHGEPDRHLYAGHWGQASHFLAVNKELGLNTAPILGEAVITRQLLESLQAAPASDGEGVVINHASGSYKAKSADYYARIK